MPYISIPERPLPELKVMLFGLVLEKLFEKINLIRKSYIPQQFIQLLLFSVFSSILKKI